MALNQDAFTSVDAESAKNGDTVMYVDGEALSYQTAELLENGTWRLSGLIRGQFGSEADYHVKGASIARCDETFLKSGLANSYIGKTVYFKFTAFNIFGGMEQSLADVRAYAFMPVSVQIPPPDVTALNAEKLASGIRRYWWKYTYPEPNDVAGFILKYTQGKELNWNTGIPVQEGLITNQPYETQTIRPGTHAVMIKAVDQNGNESKNFAYCLLEMGDLLQENVLFDKDFGADHWADIKTSGLVLASDDYIHAPNTSTMWHETGRRLWTKPTAYMWDTDFAAYEVTGEFVAPASGQLWLTTEIEGPAIVYYRQLLKGSTAEELWKQWSDKVLVQAGSTIQVKIVAKNSSVQETIVKSLHAYIDVPDREEHFEDLSVPASGIELPIVTPNYMTTAVRIDAVQGSGVVRYPKILSRTPCRIALLNEDGNQVAGVVDITWQGFVNETV